MALAVGERTAIAVSGEVTDAHGEFAPTSRPDFSFVGRAVSQGHAHLFFRRVLPNCTKPKVPI